MPAISIQEYISKFPCLKILGKIKRRNIPGYVPHILNLCEICDRANRFVWFEQECSWVEFPDGTSGFFCSGDCLHEAYLEYLIKHALYPMRSYGYVQKVIDFLGEAACRVESREIKRICDLELGSSPAYWKAGCAVCSACRDSQLLDDLERWRGR